MDSNHPITHKVAKELRISEECFSCFYSVKDTKNTNSAIKLNRGRYFKEIGN